MITWWTFPNVYLTKVNQPFVYYPWLVSALSNQRVLYKRLVDYVPNRFLIVSFIADRGYDVKISISVDPKCRNSITMITAIIIVCSEMKYVQPLTAWKFVYHDVKFNQIFITPISVILCHCAFSNIQTGTWVWKSYSSNYTQVWYLVLRKFGKGRVSGLSTRGGHVVEFFLFQNYVEYGRI